MEVLQLAAGEGPCLDCFRTGIAVTVGNLEVDADKWPKFSAEALREGFRSVHAIPLRLRGQIIGTMNLFSIHPGELAATDISVAQALADVATIGILQERTIRSSSIVAEQLQNALISRILIEQAKGVLAASTGLTMDEAFAALNSTLSAPVTVSADGSATGPARDGAHAEAEAADTCPVMVVLR